MQSKNPVFARSEEFNGTQVGSDPSQWLNGSGQYPGNFGIQQPVAGRMTLDSVVEKTAVTVGLVIATAAAAWFLIGDFLDSSGFVVDQSALNKAYMFAMGGAIIGLVLSLVNSFKKVISPPLVLAYAVAEGFFVGSFSKIVAAWVGDNMIVFQAVMATFVAAGTTLAAYKFFNIRVTEKFRKIVVLATMSFVAVVLVNFVLSLTGVLDNGGIRAMSGLGLVVSALACGLAVLNLILDFDYVERGVAAGLPERESWRAAFGLTVTLVWLYIEILRILAILRGND